MRVRALTSGVVVAVAAFAGMSVAQTMGGMPSAAMQPASASAPVVVYLDQATVVRLAAPADTILIGNPAIASVTTLDAMTLLITGRLYGRSSLTVMDADGRLIADTQIIVQAPEIYGLTIYRGTSRYSYVCYTYCQAAPIPGDDPAFFDGIFSQTQMRASIAEGG